MNEQDRQFIEALFARQGDEFRQELRATSDHFQKELQATSESLRQEFRQELQANTEEFKQHVSSAVEIFGHQVKKVRDRHFLCPVPAWTLNRDKGDTGDTGVKAI